MTRKTLTYLVLAGALLAGAGLWYLFRPERAFISRAVDEAAPRGGIVLLSGLFESRAHDGRGTAEVIELADGRRVLRFSDFETLNGPDLQVYLLARADASGRRDLQHGYLSLGALRGNVGAQNYDIPEGTDLAQYQAVAVWCRRFGVNFASAVLAPVVR